MYENQSGPNCVLHNFARPVIAISARMADLKVRGPELPELHLRLVCCFFLRRCPDVAPARCHTKDLTWHCQCMQSRALRRGPTATLHTVSLTVSVLCLRFPISCFL